MVTHVLDCREIELQHVGEHEAETEVDFVALAGIVVEVTETQCDGVRVDEFGTDIEYALQQGVLRGGEAVAFAFRIHDRLPTSDVERFRIALVVVIHDFAVVVGCDNPLVVGEAQQLVRKSDAPG